MKRSLLLPAFAVWALFLSVNQSSALEPMTDWSQFLVMPESSPKPAVAPLFELGNFHQSVVRGQYDEPLVTDRPDFTEASSTVGQGVMQLEMGYTFTYNDDEATGNRTDSHTAPEVLLRYGFLEHVELRLIWTYGWNEEQVGATRTRPDGGSDVGIGFKIDLFEQCFARPEQALIVGVTVPAGADSFSSNKVTANMVYCYSWELANEWSFSGNTGFFTDRDNGENFLVWTQSISLGVPINDCWGCYFEYFGLYESDRLAAVDQHFLNAGLTWLWNYDLQFDIRAGFGLNDDSEDFFSGLGVSMRF